MGDVATRQTDKPALVQRIEEIRPLLGQYGIDPVRFGRALASEVHRTPQLLKCSPDSFLAAAFEAAQLGLEPGPHGHYWLTPRRIKNRMEVVGILGYRGIVYLAEKDGILIQAETVYENDHFLEVKGTNRRLEHRPATGDRGAPVRWYATATWPDGRVKFRVIDRAEVEKRRAAGGAAESFGWKNWYEQMARKSAIRAMKQDLSGAPHLTRGEQMDGQVLHLLQQESVEVVSTTRTGDDGAPAPEGTATAQQLIAITQLQGRLGLSDEKLTGWIRDKFDLATVEELDEGQAAALISELQKAAP